ncbi:MAG: RNA-binding cell elongation regulator Jag/EloR [Candidatus Caccovivens sp.]
MRSCEGTGKNIEQAIQNALLELKASREDVDIKILSEGGFLKKAKVVVSISEDALDKYEKREKFKEELKKAESEEQVLDEDFAKNFVKQKIETTKEETKEETKEDKTEKQLTIVADEEYVKPEKNADKKLSANEFIQGVLNSLNLEANIEKREEERFCYYSLTGENLNDLIGHHGECMLALSQIMNLVCKNEDRKKYVLDIESYRQKREESLVALAKRVANKVAKSGRYYKLEPMDASERKIIHTALQDDDRVTTLSKGEEPRRYLIVFPKEYRDRD